MEGIEIYEDFPKKGVKFADISGLMANPIHFERIIAEMANKVEKYNNSDIANTLGYINKIAGIEARGFPFGIALAQKLKLPFIMIRKAGKLPGKVKTWKTNTEYSQIEIQVQDKLVDIDDAFCIVDDVFATGGTMKAAKGVLSIAGAYSPMALFVLDVDIADITKLKSDGFEIVHSVY